MTVSTAVPLLLPSQCLSTHAQAAGFSQFSVPMAQIGLAWVLSKPEVSAPIVGASSTAQLDDAISALQVRLTDDEIAELEKEYIPHAVAGHD